MSRSRVCEEPPSRRCKRPLGACSRVTTTSKPCSASIRSTLARSGLKRHQSHGCEVPILADKRYGSIPKLQDLANISDGTHETDHSTRLQVSKWHLAMLPDVRISPIACMNVLQRSAPGTNRMCEYPGIRCNVPAAQIGRKLGTMMTIGLRRW